MALSDRLYKLRRGSGLSQEQLAEHLNVSRQSISKWESGQAMPESEKLLAISRYFNVSVDFLLGEEDIGKKEAPASENRPEKHIAGAVVTAAGVLGLLLWGVISVFMPASADRLRESSVIQIDGNGIFLLLCVAAVVTGAVLLLKKKK